VEEVREQIADAVVPRGEHRAARCVVQPEPVLREDGSGARAREALLIWSKNLHPD
jgi:hypothetical protein